VYGVDIEAYTRMYIEYYLCCLNSGVDLRYLFRSFYSHSGILRLNFDTLNLLAVSFWYFFTIFLVDLRGEKGLDKNLLFRILKKQKL